MKTTSIKRLLSFILCIVLIAAAALFTSGCADSKKTEPLTTTTEQASKPKVTVLGEGKTMFYFSVVDGSKNETKFEIHTDKKTVGEALLDLKLIEGEDGDYGLYVKKVNGIAADYDKDKTYWAFYVNGEYAQSGVDATDITDGASYALKIEK